MSKTYFTPRKIAYLAVLTALEILLNRFLSFNVWNQKIGLSFIPIVLAAMTFGPVAGGIVGGLGDVIGAILFPIGTYFPGFTVVAFVQGCLFGLLLYRKYNILRVLMASALAQVVCTLLLNTWNISFLYDSPYWPLLVSRLFQACLVFAFQVLVIPILYRMEHILQRQVKLV